MRTIWATTANTAKAAIAKVLIGVEILVVGRSKQWSVLNLPRLMRELVVRPRLFQPRDAVPAGPFSLADVLDPTKQEARADHLIPPSICRSPEVYYV